MPLTSEVQRKAWGIEGSPTQVGLLFGYFVGSLQTYLPFNIKICHVCFVGFVQSKRFWYLFCLTWEHDKIQDVWLVDTL